MSILEEAAQKRLDAREAQAQAAGKQANLDAVRQGSDSVVAATSKLAKSEDIDSLLAQVKELTLAQYMNASKTQADKPTVILTDQTDLGDKFTELGTKLNTTISQLDSSDIDNKKLAALTKVSAAIEAFNNTLTGDYKTSQKTQTALLAAVKAINISPVVNVPEVTMPKFDLKPLQDTLREYLQPPDTSEEEADEKVDLECFKAQDIDNSVEGFQYVGFVNPNGEWYIIENDINGDKLRYVFGADGYAKAFAKASTYQYMLLNEAIDALSA